MKAEFSNPEIVTLAVFMAGGQSQYIDTEDIAMKADELAPGRFSWKKYPDQINIGNVRWALWDAKKRENGGYVLGSEKKGWLLTEAGLEFAKARIDGLTPSELARDPLPAKERQRWDKERTRLLATEAYDKVRTGQISDVTLQEAEAFFRVNDYVVGQAREQKIVRTLNMFGEDPELGRAIRELAVRVRGW
jgi:hypothetical protein